MVFSVPFWDEGEEFSVNCNAPVVGGRFLSIAGARVNDLCNVQHSGAGVDPMGVSAMDGATGDVINMYHSRDIIAPVTAGANLTAGQAVMSDANGQAIPWVSTNQVAGRCLDTASTGDLAPIDRSARA